jgi:NMD protein affecting ribosome stability and mRNA decay
MDAMMPLCPRCLQGDVATYLLKPTGEEFQVCDECEALWLPGAALLVPGFVNLYEVLEARELSESWEQLEELG